MLLPRALAILSSPIGSSVKQFVAAAFRNRAAFSQQNGSLGHGRPGLSKRNVPRNVKVTAEQEEEIVAALTAKPHALQVARDTSWSFANVWRRAGKHGHRTDRRPGGQRLSAAVGQVARQSRGSAAVKPEGDAGRGGARRRRQPPR